jgi:hypothetical protein
MCENVYVVIREEHYRCVREQGGLTDAISHIFLQEILNAVKSQPGQLMSLTRFEPGHSQTQVRGVIPRVNSPVWVRVRVQYKNIRYKALRMLHAFAAGSPLNTNVP